MSQIGNQSAEKIAAADDLQDGIVTLQKLAASAIATAQFDNSTKLATTAFAQAIGLNAGFLAVTTTTTLTAATCAGKTVNVGAASPFTVTLPLVSTMPRGVRVEFFNTSTGAVTVAAQGADVINYGPNGTVVSFVLNRGDTLVLESYGGSNLWLAVGGSRQLGGSADFGSSLASAGYQKLPSGLIVQWGGVPVTAANTQVTLNLPISFPAAGLLGVANAQTGSTSSAGALNYRTFPTLGEINFHNSSTYSTGGYYIAIGH